MQGDVAVKIIRENAGSQFDSAITDVFLKLHEQRTIKSE
jgi:HD-GYP domain-containing protein (c-di-GMP phosphodiesterase class II)